MVDVGGKKVTTRKAIAEGIVFLGSEIIETLRDNSFDVPKGPVAGTAILAGVMGAKKTSELIPLCHPLGLDNCQVSVDIYNDEELRIVCETSVTGKTGVEMEALTGVSIAALTVYDMCKAMSHEIEIRQIRLLKKEGGKNDFERA